MMARHENESGLANGTSKDVPNEAQKEKPAAKGKVELAALNHENLCVKSIAAATEISRQALLARGRTSEISKPGMKRMDRSKSRPPAKHCEDESESESDGETDSSASSMTPKKHERQCRRITTAPEGSGRRRFNRSRTPIVNRSADGATVAAKIKLLNDGTANRSASSQKNSKEKTKKSGSFCIIFFAILTGLVLCFLESVRWYRLTFFPVESFLFEDGEDFYAEWPAYALPIVNVESQSRVLKPKVLADDRPVNTLSKSFELLFMRFGLMHDSQDHETCNSHTHSIREALNEDFGTFQITDTKVRPASLSGWSLLERIRAGFKGLLGLDYGIKYSKSSSKALTKPDLWSCWHIPSNYLGETTLDFGDHCIQYPIVEDAVEFVYHPQFDVARNSSIEWHKKEGECYNKIVVRVESSSGENRPGTCVGYLEFFAAYNP